MKWFKKIILALFIIFIAIQFIQPARNQNGQVMSTDIEKIIVVPANVSGILKTSCYDCHSNNTHYPWYSFIQPGAWLMASHIKNGKSMLNFSQFGDLSNRKQQSKLQGIINQVKDGEMPISSYKIIHRNAVLTPAQKTILINWAALAQDSLLLKN
jgi:hypothetical protein